MKCLIISNGTHQLVVIPETDLEKQLLAEIFKGEVDNRTYDKLQVLDKALVDSVVISPKTKQDVQTVKEA